MAALQTHPARHEPPAHLFALTQFRTENRFTLFLELL
jgi:hypothetical protein